MNSSLLMLSVFPPKNLSKVEPAPQNHTINFGLQHRKQIYHQSLVQVDVLEDFIIIWKKGSSILALGDNVMSSDSRVKVQFKTLTKKPFTGCPKSILTPQTLMMILIIPATNIHLKQVSPMKNGNRLVISLADYKMDDGRYTCQVLIRHADLSNCRLLFGFVTKRSTGSTSDDQ